MSRSVEQRIVEMRFDNAQFERGAKDTMSLLDRLKEALSFGKSKKGLEDINEAVSAFSLEGIAAGVDNISSRFSALGAIGFSVLQDLTRRAMDFGSQMIGRIMDPIVSGGRNRALNMEQANFQFEGLGMDVEKTMESALYAVEGTAYGLDEAAVLAANFGATGMEAGEDMSNALRGVSGVAAMAGASYSDIGNIFGTVAGQGRLMGNDLNRLAARGVNAAATMSKQMGITESEFREMVSAGEISFQMFADGMNEAFGEHATKANETYTGSLSNMRAAFARVGATFFTPHLERQRDLFNAITPLINRTNEALGPLFERLNSFLDLRYEGIIDFLNMLDDDHTGGALLTTIINAIGQAADTLMSYLSPIGAAFSDIFGNVTVAGVANFFAALERVLNTLQLTSEQGENLRRTFAGIFAVVDIGLYIIWEVAKTIGRLLGIVFEGTGGFLEFTGSIGDFLVMLRDVIKEGDGLTNFLGIVETLVGGVIRAIMITLGTGGKILGLIPWETMFHAVHGFIKEVGFLEAMGFAIGAAWVGAQTAVNWVIENTPTIMEKTGDVLTSLGGWFAAIGTGISDGFFWVIDTLGKFGTWVTDTIDTISNALSRVDWETVLSFVNAGLAGGGLLILNKIIDTFKDSKGVADGINDILGALGEHLKVLQQDIRANIIVKLAAAIALLAGATWLLSQIESADLIASLGAVTGIFALLLGATAVFTKIAATRVFAHLPLLAAGLILLAGAVTLMTIPIMILSRLDWDEIARGLTAFAGIIAGMVGLSHGLSRSAPSLVSAGLAMIPFATGMGLMAVSLKLLGNLSWAEIGTGLVVVAGSLAAFAAFMNLVPAHRFVSMGAGLVFLASALVILSIPLKTFGNMEWDEIARGLVTLAGAMAALGVGLALMSGSLIGGGNMLLAAAALNLLMNPLERMGQMSWAEIARSLVMLGGALAILAGGLFLMNYGLIGAAVFPVVAVGLNLMVPALERLAAMGWDEIARGLVALGGSLSILAGGMFLLSAGIAGALILPLVAVGLTLLVPPLEQLGNLPWSVILTSLGALAGLFLTLGVSALVLTPLSPVILLLGIAVAALGAGMMGIGGGLVLFAGGVAALGAAFDRYGTVILDMIDSIITRIPDLISALADGLGDIIVSILENGERVIDALSDVLSSILDLIDENAPKIIDTAVNILVALLDGIIILAPKVREASVVVFSEILEAIRELAPEIRATLVVVILEALKGIEEVAPEAMNTMVFLLFLMMDTIEDNIDEFIERGAAIVDAIVRGILRHVFKMDEGAVAAVMAFIGGATGPVLGGVITAGGILLSRFAGGISAATTAMPIVARGAVARFIGGADGQRLSLIGSGARTIGRFSDGIGRGFGAMPILAGTAVSRFIGGSDGQSSPLRTAGGRLLGFLSGGITGRFSSMPGVAAGAIGRFIGGSDGQSTPLGTAGGRALSFFSGGISGRFGILPGVAAGAVGRFVSGSDGQRFNLLNTGGRVLSAFSGGITSRFGLLPGVGMRSVTSFVGGLLSGASVSSLMNGGRRILTTLGNSITSGIPGWGVRLGARARSIGSSIISGITGGITGGAGRVATAATSAASAAFNAAKARLGIRSPSRVFMWVGKMIDEGMSKGITDNVGTVANASETMGNTAVDRIKEALAQMPRDIDALNDYNPVIRPVVDLDEVRRGASLMNDMLGESSSVGYSRAASLAQERRQQVEQLHETSPPSVVNTYNQNITSLRALSEGEIYRRSKNLFARTKGELYAVSGSN